MKYSRVAIARYIGQINMLMCMGKEVQCYWGESLMM